MTFEQQKNTKALVWTVGVHILLLLTFLLVKYTMPVQLPVEELGMEVNLGTSEDGLGTDQPELMGDPGAAVSQMSRQTPAAATSSAEVHSSDDDDAPVVSTRANRSTAPNQSRNTRRTNSPATRQTQSQASTQPRQTAKYVYPGSTGSGGNNAQNNKEGGNEGIGQGDGDMGVPGGTPGASNYKGTPGTGSTMGFSMSGRSLVSRPDPKAEFREGGKVVIAVTVNREGTITESRVKSASNSTIRALALKKLRSVRFNKSLSAPPEQFGEITFVFKATR